MSERPEPARTWFLRGMRGMFSVPALILMISMAGYGVLCRESGLSFGQSVFTTAAIWALPSQLVLVGAIAAGASLPTATIGVALSAIRFVPMIAAWVPLVRSERVPRWRILAMSHFCSVTPWVFAMLRLPKVPAEARLVYFAGFALTLGAACTIITGAAYLLAGAMPPVIAALMFFLTPLYFVTALTASSRLAAERLALALGLVLGPVFRLSGLPLDLVWSGLIGGTLAYAGHRILRRRGAS